MIGLMANVRFEQSRRLQEVNRTVCLECLQSNALQSSKTQLNDICQMSAYMINTSHQLCLVYVPIAYEQKVYVYALVL